MAGIAVVAFNGNSIGFANDMARGGQDSGKSVPVVGIEDSLPAWATLAYSRLTVLMSRLPVTDATVLPLLRSTR